MTVYRRPDPIPLHRARPSADFSLHAVRSEQEDLTHLVSRQIFAAVMAGSYPEGSILPNEEALSLELGVSRTALRESVKGLVAKGILETRRRRGTLVLPRQSWNLFDAQIIVWMRRDDSRSVTAQLLETLDMAIPAAVRLAAGHRAFSGLAKSVLCGGDSTLSARAAFLIELGAASNNAFIASIVATVVTSLGNDDPNQFDRRTRVLTPETAVKLVDLIRTGNGEAAAGAMDRVVGDLAAVDLAQV
ncbi:MAG: GntR family transcriptional regulator [Devosia sp.]